MVLKYASHLSHQRLSLFGYFFQETNLLPRVISYCINFFGLIQSVNTGIITDIDTEIQEVRCAFCIKGGITDISVRKHTASFTLNGAQAIRRAYPIINAYAFTVHKVQGITLPKVSPNLDAQMF
ncbi:hypothetical protein Glove_84g45 [Diversispora epigaea]|uniref:Uncharacterized protein n=1 Tax=Diversispora epigaea TaxID=1348612 RepID=A0A397JGB9_9GLOM|nr:hypothetical protein Glove_84g45 [Diversispora epigaea]